MRRGQRIEINNVGLHRREDQVGMLALCVALCVCVLRGEHTCGLCLKCVHADKPIVQGFVICQTRTLPTYPFLRYVLC